VAAAKVCGAASESPSVKSLRLLIADKDFSFKAGQWIDFFIPGVSVVGGFSICSSPRLLEQERMIELAVKYTNHPPALWIHNKCTLDSEVAVRVGGDFFFDPQPTDAPRNLVLIAGGVGINPLLSILRHSADLHRERANKGSGYEIGTIKLFYSAKNTSELLFKKNIFDLVNEFPEKIACSLHVTKQTTQISAELKPYITDVLDQNHMFGFKYLNEFPNLKAFLCRFEALEKTAAYLQSDHFFKMFINKMVKRGNKCIC
ncbi:Oxidoreductase NAD-binding domain-containing protein 1, partial [Sciurus carolinensis]|nr:Oxidoreductase NAD-binding domain-containing protein 1 [Sciurus carolinensis]